MKTLYYVLIVFLILASCKTKNKDLENSSEALEEKVSNEKINPPTNENIVSSDNVPKGPLPVISYKEESFDFGTIKEGDKVNHTFEFTNTGEAPLVIQNASASCGCTIPSWPHEPIEPGKKGKIDVVFNSAGKAGPQTKNISITANTNPVISTVSIVGVVEAKSPSN